MKLVSKSFNTLRNVIIEEENNTILKNLDSNNLDILYNNIKKVLDLKKKKKLYKKIPYFRLAEDLTILHFVYFAKKSVKSDNNNISKIINDLSNLNIINKSEEAIKLRYDLILQFIKINEIRNFTKLLLKEKKSLYLYKNNKGCILITKSIKTASYNFMKLNKEKITKTNDLEENIVKKCLVKTKMKRIEHNNYKENILDLNLSKKIICKSEYNPEEKENTKSQTTIIFPSNKFKLSPKYSELLNLIKLLSTKYFKTIDEILNIFDGVSGDVQDLETVLKNNEEKLIWSKMEDITLKHLILNKGMERIQKRVNFKKL